MSAYGSPDEALRVQALHALQILDTPPEKTYDDAVELAAALCSTPIALINLLDSDRQWYKARVGMPVTEMPREHGFCNHAIGRKTLLVIPDTAADARLTGNPNVTRKPGVRFYAGMPLNTTEGHTFGTLCVADAVPRELTEVQKEALSALGRQVSAQIELRAKNQMLAKVIREKEGIERELRNRTVLFGAFMDHSPMIGLIKDGEGRFLYYNRVFCERFGVTPTEWIGKSVLEVFPEDFANAYHAVDMAVLKSGEPEVLDETSPGKDGTTLYWRTHKFRIADGSNLGLLGALSLDTSKEREAARLLEIYHAKMEAANQKLTTLSVTDSLTGLRNRRAFEEQLAREFASGIPFSLILLDIDCFKELNDSFGHSTGDDVLRVMARLLQENSRSYDLVARYGGEEFAVLLPLTDADQALLIAERMRRSVESFAWRQRAVTVSLGVATRTSSVESEVELVEAADTALYCAKGSGRNCVEAATAAALLILKECATMGFSAS